MAKKGLGKFILGAGIGAGLGLLFAPKAGSETRKELKVKIDDLVSKAKELDMNDVTTQVEEKISEIKKDLNEEEKDLLEAFEWACIQTIGIYSEEAKRNRELRNEMIRRLRKEMNNNE